MTKRCAFLFALSALLLLTSGAKKRSILVTFHLEGGAEDMKYVFQYPVQGERRYFRKTPEISGRHIAGFRPFQAEDGTFGSAFKLTEEGKRALANVSFGNQGKYLMPMVDLVPKTAVMIDRPINDGMLIIWSGISQAQITEMDKKFGRLGARPGIMEKEKKEPFNFVPKKKQHKTKGMFLEPEEVPEFIGQ